MRIDYSTIANLTPEKPMVPASDLVDVATHMQDWRIEQCGGVDPLSVVVAYSLPLGDINRLGQVYKPDAKLWLHKTLADILVCASILLRKNHGWNMVVYDGLRAIEPHHELFEICPQFIVDCKMLARPGQSAHNRAMAVDWMAVDPATGQDIEVEGFFDCPDMELVHRENKNISAKALENRRIREEAIQHAALSLGTIIAPLREEFWDDRMLGAETDFWRAIESWCRILKRQAPEEKVHDYASFVNQFEELGIGPAPKLEHIVFHERFRPIYDSELPPEKQQGLKKVSDTFFRAPPLA